MPDETSVKHGLYLAAGESISPQQVVAFAVEADRAGWDGVFLSDSLVYGFQEPWSILSAIAVETETVTLGTWISPIPRHQPWQLAHMVASIDRLSDGRVLLGGGLGTPDEYQSLGFEESMAERGDRYDEILEIIDRLWSGESITFDGEYYSLDEVSLSVTPVQEPRVPIVLAGWWPNKKPFRRAARWDGVMPYWPGLIGKEGPQGEDADGSIVEQMHEVFEYYTEHADDPGEIVLPIDPHQGTQQYIDEAVDLGVTWFLTTFYDRESDFTLDEAIIREGPPM